MDADRRLFLQFGAAALLVIVASVVGASWAVSGVVERDVAALLYSDSGVWVRTTRGDGGESYATVLRYTDMDTGVVCYTLATSPGASFQCVGRLR